VVIVIPVLKHDVGVWRLTKNFHLHNKHQKSKRKTLFFYTEEQNNWQTIVSEKFRKGRKFRLTPGN